MDLQGYVKIDTVLELASEVHSRMRAEDPTSVDPVGPNPTTMVLSVFSDPNGTLELWYANAPEDWRSFLTPMLQHERDPDKENQISPQSQIPVGAFV